MRTWKSILTASLILLMLCNAAHRRARAQESSSSPSQESFLPNAPQPAQIVSQSEESDPQRDGDASISGTVLDTSGGAVQDATVTLTGQSPSETRSVKSGNDGQFAFANLPVGAYKVTVTGRGMSR